MASSAVAQSLALGFLFRGTTTGVPTEWWVALLTADGEVDGTDYARISVTFLDPLAGVVRNSADVAFGVGDADWGVVTGFAIYTDETAGDSLGTGALTNFTPDGVEPITIAAGGLEITLE